MNAAQQYQMIEMTSSDGDDDDENENVEGADSDEIRAKHNKKRDTPKFNRLIGQILTVSVVIMIGFIFVLFVISSV